MILYGQYDSPFVRRVAVAMNHYGMPFERRVLSVFQDFEAMLAINPLGKVPVLAFNDSTVLADSRAILDYLDRQAEPERRLTPTQPDLLKAMLHAEAIGIGLAEKTYERGIEFSRKQPAARDAAWIERLERQIASALAWLDERVKDGWIVGDRMTRADLAAVMAATYLAEKAPRLFDPDRFSALHVFRERCEALPAFSAAAYSASEAAATGWRPETA